jgi:hypothetical protein
MHVARPVATHQWSFAGHSLVFWVFSSLMREAPCATIDRWNWEDRSSALPLKFEASPKEYVSRLDPMTG